MPIINVRENESNRWIDERERGKEKQANKQRQKETKDCRKP